MKRFFVSLLMISLLLAGSAFGDEPRCPVLKHGQGIEWTFQQGPDFGLCCATDKTTKNSLFGLYFGFAPSFHPGDSKSIGQGTVAGKPVSWYATEKGLAKAPFKKQALVEINKNDVIHVWISATTEADMKRARLCENSCADSRWRKIDHLRACSLNSGADHFGARSRFQAHATRL